MALKPRENPADNHDHNILRRFNILSNSQRVIINNKHGV